MLQVKNWEDVKVLPQPRPAMEVGGTVWAMVDEIEMQYRRSEAAHAFAIHGATTVTSLRSKQWYADGTQVEDTGYWQTHGRYEFALRGVTASRPVVILYRADPALRNYQLDVEVDGTRIGDVTRSSADHGGHWQNLPIPVAAEHVHDGMQVRLTSRTPDLDIPLFHVWVYQPR
jgi:hypothetical protein